MKKVDIKTIILIIYLQIILVLYFWLIFPSLAKPKDLAQTEVPSLSLSGLRQANDLFTSYGKVWSEYPTEPDISTYSFGQENPI